MTLMGALLLRLWSSDEIDGRPNDACIMNSFWPCECAMAYEGEQQATAQRRTGPGAEQVDSRTARRQNESQRAGLWLAWNCLIFQMMHDFSGTYSTFPIVVCEAGSSQVS